MTKPDTSRSDNATCASTVVIFRHGAEGASPEILMVTRSRKMSFAGGAAVFPGGKVDDADFDLARSLETQLDIEEAAHRIAAIRETLEETGLVIGIERNVDAVSARKARELLLEQSELAPVLSAMGWSVNLSAILPFARWFPKNEKLPRVFDTRFYLANLGTGAVDIAVDKTENTKLYWITAQAALDAADRGDLSVIFPTRRNLERLAQFASFEQAEADCAKFPVRTITPFMEMRGDQRYLCIDEDAGYPICSELLEVAMRG